MVAFHQPKFENDPWVKMRLAEKQHFTINTVKDFKITLGYFGLYSRVEQSSRAQDSLLMVQLVPACTFLYKKTCKKMCF